MENPNKSSRKGIIIVLLLALGASLYFFRAMIFSQDDKDSGNAIATVTTIDNDVKQKKMKSMDFKKAKPNDAIRVGDSIFTGNSSVAQVKFKNGDGLTIGQNSLVVFDDTSGMMEFSEGNMKIRVGGTMKIKMNGEIVELNGSGSTIQLYTDKTSKTVKVMLLEGKATVRNKVKSIKLERNLVATIKDPPKNDQVINDPPIRTMAAVPVPQKFYRFYDVYAKADTGHLELKFNPKFVPKPEIIFEKLTASNISIQPVNQPNKEDQYEFKINDQIPGAGYVIEVSPASDFQVESKLHWSGTHFEREFTKPGTYFVRYRKVLINNNLTEYSAAQKIEVLAKAVLPVEKVALKPKKIQAAIKVKKVVVKKAVVREIAATPPPAVVVEKKVEVPVNTNTSTEKVESVLLRNVSYDKSFMALYLAQVFLASGPQIANGKKYQGSFSLGLDIRHWRERHGLKFNLNQTMMSDGGTNKVTAFELGYLYSFYQKWSASDTGSFQYFVTGGIESYKLANATDDYLSSYDLYKFGLGASMPVFSFWQVEGELAYGLGSKIDSVILLSGRTNYFLTKDSSIGIGFRARKIDYKLLDKITNESLSETFTTYQKHY